MRAAIADAAGREDEVVMHARSGEPVNGLRRDDRAILFHSRYAPRREAERLASSAGSARFVVSLGMGMGHLVNALDDRGIRVLVIEPDTGLLRSALEARDFSRLLRSGRLGIATGETRRELVDALARAYFPSLDGDLTVLELPGRVAAERERFAALRQRLRASTDEMKSDLAVQARFGLRWMRNALYNVVAAQPRPLPDWTGSHVAVAAAGPSLGDALENGALPDADRLIAVDTALPVLLAHHERPDLAVSIDCQLTSYHHFLCAGHPDVPTVAELSLPPSLFRRLLAPLPVLSHHPLHRLIEFHGLALPLVDATGGNVAQTAVDLAVRLGASRVTLVGADYSYPDGETYPRGSYIHRYFESRATRLDSLSTHHLRFLLERPGVERVSEHPVRWSQPVLRAYGERMSRFAASLPIPVDRLEGRGASVPGFPAGIARAGARADARPGVTTPETGPQAAEVPSRRELLIRIRESLLSWSGTEELRSALRTQDSGREAGRGYAARAILPLLTYLRAKPDAPSGEELLRTAREITQTLVDDALRLC
jgi:hypothetical protein